MNHKVKLDHKIKPVGYDDETLAFNDGSYLFFDHQQTCCEWNYADFSSLDNTGFFESEFDVIDLEEGDWGGFRINGFAVNCYSQQNGYYSSGINIYYSAKTGETLCKIETEGDVIE